MISVRHKPFSLLLMMPAQLVLLLVLVMPCVFAFFISFFNFTYGQPTEFVGWDNYIFIFSTPLFWRAFWHNIIFVNVVVYLEMLLGLGIALFFTGRIPLRRVMVSIVIAPYAISTSAAVVMWRNMLLPDVGMIHVAANLFGLPQLNWATNSLHAFIVVIMLSIWLRLPFTFLILYNALLGVPTQLVEAAEVDGANSFQKFWRVIFPTILPSFLIALTFRYIFAFRTFDVIWIMTKGGPFHGTELLSTYLYRETFSYFNFSTGSAVGVTMVIITLILSHKH